MPRGKNPRGRPPSNKFADRDAKRKLKSKVVRISLKTADRLEKIKVDRSRESFEEVIMILLER